MAVVQNVSDTARWVAAYRAIESERPDALFCDPYARELAGEEGERILRELWGGRQMAWALSVRTHLIDQMILRAIRDEGIDCVINLACGLDARPYRLSLPESLRWVEADFPDMVHYKEEKLRNYKPVCSLERLSADLSQATPRRELLARAHANSKKALVLTEGLLCYLTEEQVKEVARDLSRQAGLEVWIMDLFSAQLVSLVKRTWGRQLAEGNASIRFGSAKGPDFFRPLGWTPQESSSILEGGRTLGRDLAGADFWRPLFSLAPKRTQEFFRQMYTIQSLRKAT